MTYYKDVKTCSKEIIHLFQLPSSYQPEIILLDLENLAEIPRNISEAGKIHNRVDILINNAGISYRGEIQNTSLDVDIKLMTVNYFAQVAIIKGKVFTGDHY